MSDTTFGGGGAINFARKVFFQDVTSPVVPSVVSSNASDTGGVGGAKVTVYSLSTASVLQSETIAPNGTTVAAGTLTASRLMKALTITAAPFGDLAVLGNQLISAHTMQAASTTTATLQSGDGATVSIGTIIRITNNLPSSGVE